MSQAHYRRYPETEADSHLDGRRFLVASTYHASLLLAARRPRSAVFADRVYSFDCTSDAWAMVEMEA